MDIVATPMTCTHCGAPLDPAPGASEVRCSFCQQVFAISSAKPHHPEHVPPPKPLHRPMPSESAPRSEAAAPVVAKSSRSVGRVIGWTLSLAICGVGVSVARAGLTQAWRPRLAQLLPTPQIGPRGRPPAAPPGSGITAGTLVVPGEEIWVLRGGSWTRAKVLLGGPHGPIQVRFLQVAGAADETVTRDRVRR